ncbi:MAG: uroporphyrinogen-III synthase [Campylobacterales bacterium]|nr:uroporphyrinogen-III synthase [Campylobacterales bacterium]
MTNFTKMINKLNLLYYEYDINKKSFMPDVSYSTIQRYDELMKLTYALSKNRFDFFVQRDKSVVLLQDEEPKGFISKNIEAIVKKIKISNMNIYTLNDKKTKFAKNIPLYNITHVENNIDFSKYDALIFTSQNAVLAVNSFSSEWKKIPAYTIAAQTAKTVKKLGGNLKFVSLTKHGNEFANELINELKGKKVLYLRGKKVVTNLIEILKDAEIDCENIISYENSCNENIKAKEFPENSYIIFSSPSTIHCFFKKFKWKESYTAISIGHTTAKFFPENIEPHIADTTSIESCINKAIEVELNTQGN